MEATKERAISQARAKLIEATSEREKFERIIRAALPPGFHWEDVILFAMWFAEEEKNTAELAQLEGPT